jgi:hypothetical protein
MGCVGTTKTGPNDASCVVWVLGKLFLNYPSIFLDTNYRFIVYIGSTNKICDRVGRDNENEPKRRQTRRLDPR